MAKCLRCGQCCTSASINLSNVLIDHDEQEIGKWLEAHRCTLEKVETPHGIVLGVRIPLTCRHLIYDSGMAVCLAYDNRPVICREYLCDRAKG